MAHPRKIVRDAVKAIIDTVPGITLVSADTALPIVSANLPCCRIMVARELVTAKSLGMPRVNSRNLLVEVSIYVRAATAAQDALDDLCLLVEQALFATDASRTLNGVAKFVQLEAVVVDIDQTGEREWARATHSLTVGLLATENAPQTLL